MSQSRLRASSYSASPIPTQPQAPSSDARAARAALEALFAPKQATPPPPPTKRDSAKMVVARKKEDGPREAERARLVDRLMAAVGRSAITRAADDLARAGLLPDDRQEVHLQLLEHADEARVREALGALGRRLDAEPPHRRAVMEARVRRLESDADDPETRALAAAIKKKLRA